MWRLWTIKAEFLGSLSVFNGVKHTIIHQGRRKWKAVDEKWDTKLFRSKFAVVPTGRFLHLKMGCVKQTCGFHPVSCEEQLHHCVLCHCFHSLTQFQQKDRRTFFSCSFWELVRVLLSATGALDHTWVERSRNFPRGREEPLEAGTMCATEHCTAPYRYSIFCVTISGGFNLALVSFFKHVNSCWKFIFCGLLTVDKVLNSWRAKHNEIFLSQKDTFEYLNSKTFTEFHGQKAGR